MGERSLYSRLGSAQPLGGTKAHMLVPVSSLMPKPTPTTGDQQV